MTAPTDGRYYNDDYDELFERTEVAMDRLLEDDTPENRVKAYCHYHLTIESILAQTGYYGFQSAFSETGSDEIINEDFEEMGEEAGVDDSTQLPGLVNGIAKIRSDEGRHVGFGMQKVRGYVQDGTVDQDVVETTLNELVPLVAGSVADLGDTVNSGPLVSYAREKFNRRLEIIADADAELPPVEELVEVEGAEAAD